MRSPGGAKRICLVASGRGPSDRDVSRVAETVRVIKERHPGVEICTSLGLLSADRAERLAEVGVFAYNHNLNTSEANYGEICSTHTYADRVETVGVARMAGLSPCSGAIFGMGEADDEIVDLAIDLRKVDPDSVPVNFLIPFEGTPLAGEWQLTPRRCLGYLPCSDSSSPTPRSESLAGERFISVHSRPSRSPPRQLHLPRRLLDQ